jgi:hypothetical protein
MTRRRRRGMAGLIVSLASVKDMHVEMAFQLNLNGHCTVLLIFVVACGGVTSYSVTP